MLHTMLEFQRKSYLSNEKGQPISYITEIVFSVLSTNVYKDYHNI